MCISRSLGMHFIVNMTKRRAQIDWNIVEPYWNHQATWCDENDDVTHPLQKPIVDYVCVPVPLSPTSYMKLRYFSLILFYFVVFCSWISSLDI